MQPLAGTVRGQAFARRRDRSVSLHKGGKRPSVLPRWARVALIAVIVSLGLLTAGLSLAAERWSSAIWHGLTTLVVTIVLARGLRRREERVARVDGLLEDIGGATPSWDAPGFKKAAANVVLVCVLVGLFGLAMLWWGAARSSTAYDEWLMLAGGPVLMLLGFGTASRIVYRWRRRAPLRQP